MNPNSGEQPNISLPAPAASSESLSLSKEPMVSKPAAPEALPQSGANAMPAIAPTVSPAPIAPAHVPQPSPAQSTTSNLATPQAASDSDRIEKEWVIKAKQIIYETRSDPSAQSKQINRMRADYLKKRFNKDLSAKE